MPSLKYFKITLHLEFAECVYVVRAGSVGATRKARYLQAGSYVQYTRQNSRWLPETTPPGFLDHPKPTPALASAHTCCWPRIRTLQMCRVGHLYHWTSLILPSTYGVPWGASARVFQRLPAWGLQLPQAQPDSKGSNILPHRILLVTIQHLPPDQQNRNLIRPEEKGQKTFPDPPPPPTPTPTRGLAWVPIPLLHLPAG